MTLAAGTRLGPYEILAPLGTGGMGEVYRARDTKLGREVAIKVLPERLSEKPGALARLEREARAIAALSHPNILGIFDFSRHDGVTFAVMELLEGETLRDRLAEGNLPSRKAVEFALQIVRGLAAAHEKGIVHRDLKPENVFITRDGRIKILDFGLAKLREPEREPAETRSPTVGQTEPGVVMGTVGYMSPEQVRALLVDHRSDIFSFGAILYEMLSGRRAFQGASPAETMTAIAREDPPEVSQINSSVSPALDRLVRRCLEKRPEERFHSAHDLGIALETFSESVSTTLSAASVPTRRIPRIGAPVLGVLAGFGLVGLLGYLAGYGISRRAPAQRTPRATYEPLTFKSGIETSPSLSPDGKSVAYVSDSSGNADIYLQRVRGRNAINLTQDSPQDDGQPAFSPEGSEIAFRSERDGGGIFVMGATGESVRRLTNFGFDPAWSPDGKELVVATERVRDPLSRYSKSKLWAVNAVSGEKRVLGEDDAVQPSCSPHGHRIAYWGLLRGTGQRDIWTMPAAGIVRGGQAVPVTHDVHIDWNPFWSADGRFLYFVSDRDGTMGLFKVSIEEKTGRVLSEPEPISTASRWSGWFSASRDSRQIVYAAVDEASSVEKASFDPLAGKLTGAGLPIIRGSLLIRNLDISPDGERIVFASRGRQEDIFVMRSDGTALRQLTNDTFKDRAPRWSPDGQRIGFYSNRGGRYDAWAIGSDGSGLTQLTTKTSRGANSLSWSPDGSRIAFSDASSSDSFLQRVGRPAGEVNPEVLARFEGGSFNVTSWSPNGAWLAGEIRKDSVLVPGLVLYSLEEKSYRRVNDRGRKWVWLPDARRMLFEDGTKIFLLELESKRTREIAQAPWNENSEENLLAVSRDGRFLYMVGNSSEADIWQLTFR